MIPHTNYLAGRNGERIEGTVVHWTVGTAASALAHFSDPASRVSAHYIIDRDGTRIPVLAEADAAFHAGDMMTNLRTVGVEHVGGPGWNNTFADAQYAESARLHRELSVRHGFPLDAQHVRPHRAIVPTQCPGTFDIIRILRSEDNMTEDEIREIAKAECRAVLSKESWLADAIETAVKRAVAAVAAKLAA